LRKETAQYIDCFKKNDLVFFSNCGTRLNNCNLIRAFKKAVNKTEISNFTWHGLRRAFATRLAHKGLDIYKISRLLGHEDVQTTQKRYAHHCTESLRIGVDILDVDYNWRKRGVSGCLEIAVSHCERKSWGTRI
jgi:site-specific recombinase XerD